jgi:hypothetical protein
MEGGKIREKPFFAKLIFLPSFRRAAIRGAQSSSVKPGQTSLLGQAGASNSMQIL